MTSILRNAVAGVAIASLGFASAASAATTDSADVQAEILTALSVDMDPADDTLDFGTIADGGIAGATNLTVDTADTLVACPANLVCGGTTASPTFNITGLTGMTVDVSFANASETLNHTGVPPVGMLSTLTASAFTTSLVGNSIVLDGTDSFTVGGTLTVNPNQAPGVYLGSVTVNVAYN
jgi:hypothetical protein